MANDGKRPQSASVCADGGRQTKAGAGGGKLDGGLEWRSQSAEVRVKSVFGWLRRRLGRETEWREEIEGHLAMGREWNETRGFTPAEAQRLAHKQFGNAARALED